MVSASIHMLLPRGVVFMFINQPSSDSEIYIVGFYRILKLLEAKRAFDKYRSQNLIGW